MIGNIKVFDKMINFVKERPKDTVVIVGTGVLITALILSNIPSKPKEVFPYMPRPMERVEQQEEVIPQKKTSYMTYTVRVAENQIMRLEPRSDGKYVDKIVGNNEVDLLYVDGNYALINYTDNNGIARLGFVETERIAHFDEVGPIYRADKLDMFACINNNCRLQNDTFDDYDEPNILTRANKGEYVKIIGSIKEGKELWYIVIYRDYIGYMKPDNLTILSEEEFNSIINTNYVEVVASKLRFRSSPNINDNNIIDKIPNGTKLPIISSKDKDWYYVYYNGEYGYVSKRSDCTKEIYENITPAGLANIHLDRESSKSI